MPPRVIPLNGVLLVLKVRYVAHTYMYALSSYYVCLVSSQAVRYDTVSCCC